MRYLLGLLLVVVSWLVCVVIAKIIDKSNEKKDWFLEIRKRLESEK